MQVAASQVSIGTQTSRVSGASTPMTAVQAIDALKANSKLKLEVNDTAANIAANFDGLLKMGINLSKLSLKAGTPTSMTLTASQYTSGVRVLSAIKTSYELNVTNVTMEKFNTVSHNAKVKNVQVTDTSANISAKFQNLLNMPGKIGSIKQLDPNNSISLTGELFNRSTSTAVLAKMDPGYTVTLSAVKIGANGTGSGTSLAAAISNSHVTSISVRDTSANISANLLNGSPDLSNGKISSVIQTDSIQSIAVTEAQLLNQTSTLNKLAGTSSLTVTGVTAGNALTVANNSKVKSFSVIDNAANIVAKKTDLADKSSKISSITINDTGANFANNLNALRSMQGITKVSLNDTGTAKIAITGAQLKDNTALLGKVHGQTGVKGDYKLAVSAVLAADVLAAAKLVTVDTISVTDSVLNANANLAALKDSSKVNKIELNGANTLIASSLANLDGLGSKLVSVANTSATGSDDIGISYMQYVQSTSLAKIDKGQYVVSDASSAVVKSMNADAKVKTFSVIDSAAKISQNYTDITDALAGTKLTAIKVSDTAGIKLTAAQYTEASGNGLLATKMQGTFSLQLSGVKAADIVALSITDHFGKVGKVSISDTSANISSKLTELAAQGKVDAIYLADDTQAIDISKADYDNTAVQGVLAKISKLDGSTPTYKLDVTGVKAADASSLLTSNGKITKLSITDTAANISSNLTGIAGIAAAKLTAVTVSNVTTNIDITATQLASATVAAVLDKTTPAYQLNVSDVGAVVAKSLSDSNSHINAMSVKDTATNYGTKFAEMNELATSGKLTAITLTDPVNSIVLTDTQYANNTASSLAILNDSVVPAGDYKLSIAGVSVADATDALKKVNADTHVSSYSVKDTGANITAKLSELGSSAKLQSINWTDTVETTGSNIGDKTALDITGDQYHNLIGTLSKINGGQYNAHISALFAGDTFTAQSDENISQFSVKDTAENLGKNLAALQAAAAKTGTDAVNLGVSSNEKIQEIKQTDTAAVAMTAAGYTASEDARDMMKLGAAATGGLIDVTVSGVTAGNADDVAGDTQVKSFTVSDSATNIAAKLGVTGTLDDLDKNVLKITAVTVTGAEVLALTGAQYADNKTGILSKLSNATAPASGQYRATITALAAANVAGATADVNVQSFAVTDTGANLSGTKFADLVAANVAGKLTGAAISGTDPIEIPLASLVANPTTYANTLNKFGASPPKLTLTTA